MDLGRGRSCCARKRHLDRRRAAIAVLVSPGSRGASGISAAGLAAAQFGNCAAARCSMSPSTCVMPSSNAAASVTCASTASRLRQPGTRSPGIYKTRDQRFVRLHTNFPHHRGAVCKVLNCQPEREQVQAALMQWDAEAFEAAAYAAGGVVAMMRSYENGPSCRTQRRSPHCRRFRSKKSARPRQSHGPGATARSPASASLICRG